MQKFLRKKDSCSQEHHQVGFTCAQERGRNKVWHLWSWICEWCEQSVVLGINALGKPSSTVLCLVLVCFFFPQSVEAPNSSKPQLCEAASLSGVQHGATRTSAGASGHWADIKERGKKWGKKRQDSGFYRVVVLS